MRPGITTGKIQKKKANDSTKRVHRFIKDRINLLKVREMKREMRELILIVFLLLPGSLIAQTSYYVSSSEGNDSNSGTTTSEAWKSLEKVNSFKPQAGDKVLFKRGDAWAGTLTPPASGSAGNPITYGAYGTGDKPKIYGSEVITGWTVHKGNIYKATVGTDITQLFIDDVRMSNARYPNVGYHTITSVASTTQFTSTDLDGGIDYSGALVVARVAGHRWRLKLSSISSSSGQTINLSSAISPIAANDGFFLMNKLDFLDTAGEWVYDSTTGTVYLWVPNGDDPSNYPVRGSIYDRGIDLNYRQHITVNNLDIRHQKIDGIRVRFSEGGINIIDNTIADQELSAINVNAGTPIDINIDNNVIFGQTSYGILVWTGTNMEITNNTINNIFLVKNFGLRRSEYGVGIDLSYKVNDYTVAHNTIKDVGYNGMNINGTDVVVEYNYLKNLCLTTDDGGGIYANGVHSDPTDMIVQYNIIENIETGKMPLWSGGFGNGLYSDNYASNITFQYNTVIGASYFGIYLHENEDMLVQYNTVYNSLKGYVVSAGEADNNTVSNNIIMNDVNQPINNRLTEQYIGSSTLLVADNNTYVDHLRTQVFRYAGTTYDFAGWKTATGQDANSTFDNSTLAKDEKEELFYNATKQIKTIDLGSFVYRDIDGNEVSGSISLEPFTSQILIKTTKEISKVANRTPEISDQSFDINQAKDVNNLIGQVIASDPDAGQELTYTIVEGNGDQLFAIDALTGELVANTSIPATADQTIVLTVQVTDNASTPLSANAQISIVIHAIETAAPAPDTTSPTIASFSIPSSYHALTVPIAEYTASDNLAVAGYQLTETATAPTADGPQWTTSAPESYTFSEEGTHTLYAWVKDAAGNISAATSSSVSISLPDLSPTFSEYLFEESAGETVVDTQGSNDGTLLNEELRVEGVNGDGLQLTGKGHINLGNSFGENVREALTLSAWIQPQSSSSGYQGIIMHGGPNIDSYALYIHSGDQSISFKTTGTTSAWTSIGNIASLWDGNWHHLAVTYNGAQKVIYLNDEILLTIDATGSIESGEGYNLLIGAGRDDENPNLLYEGLLDEVRIYNTALTSTEISELYNRVNLNPNQSPEVQAQSFKITEPKSINALIGTIAATDPDVDQTLSYAITAGNTEGLFKINPQTGEIFANTNLPASADQTITLLVKVTDNHQEPLSASANVTITIQAVELNQSPVVQNLIVDVEGNLEVNDWIGKIVASDPDAGQLLTYTITGGNEAGLFNIKPETGEIHAAADFITTTDQTVVLTIEVKDNATEPLAATATATINITGVQLNQSPVIEDQMVEIQDEIQINDFILQVVASDPDTDQKLTYAIIQGNEAGLFKINPETGEIFANAAIPATDNQSFTLVVQVTDNAGNPLSAHANITIISLKVAEINKQPVAQNLTVEIAGNFGVNDFVGKIVASDPDAGQLLTYTITGGNEAGLFNIKPETGEIHAAADFITTTDQTVVLTIEVKDNATEPLATSATATINIIGIQLNQSPVIADQSFEIDGDLGSNEFIGQLFASDPDAGQKLSYSIVQGNEGGLFKLNPETGEIFANQAISVNSNESLTLVVQVTDDHQIPLSAHANVTIHITPVFVNQSPVIVDQSFEIRKNNKLGDMIGQVIATDPNTEQGLTFSILSGNEEGLFTIDPATGGLYATDAIQLSASETIIIEVAVTDNAVEPLSASAYITINIVINGKIVDGEVKNSNPKRIILAYSEPLETDNLKSSQIYSDFVLSDGNVVRKVSVKGNEIYLDLDSKYEHDDEIIVSYSRGTTPIYDQSGNEMEPFDNYVVTNNIMMGNVANSIDPTANALDAMIYPNPSDGQINIRANNLTSDDCELFLFSMTGNLVSKQLVSASFGSLEERLNLSHLNKGTYIIKLISKRQIFQEKIVIL